MIFCPCSRSTLPYPYPDSALPGINMAGREVLGRFGQHQQDHATSRQMPVLHAVCLLTGSMTVHRLWQHVHHMAAQHKSYNSWQALCSLDLRLNVNDVLRCVECS